MYQQSVTRTHARPMSLKIRLALLLTLVAPAVYAQAGLLKLADSLQSAFEYPAAIEAYRSALSKDSAVTFALLNGLSTAENMLGLDLLARGKRDSAKVHFELATDAALEMLEQFPDSADSHFAVAAAKGNLALLSGAKTKVGLGREVESHALRAVELDSMHADALAVLGVFYREVSQLNWIERLAANSLFGGLPSGSLSKSETYLRQALSADPESPFAAYELGQTLVSTERPAEARDVFERLLSMKPRNSENARDIEEARLWLSRRTE